MIKKGLMAEEQLIAKAIDLLMETLGPVETSRFLSLPRAKRMESVKRHRHPSEVFQERFRMERNFPQSCSPMRWFHDGDDVFTTQPPQFI
jgi:hypothetical protein